MQDDLRQVMSLAHWVHKRARAIRHYKSYMEFVRWSKCMRGLGIYDRRVKK